jgi:DNA primase
MTDYVVDILSEFLGEPRKHNEGKGQIAFDCPACAEEKGLYGETDGKGNLEVNYHRGIYKCWACYSTNNTKGGVSWLIKKYGNKDILSRYNLVKPDYRNDEGEKVEVKHTESLPEGYNRLTPRNAYLEGYDESMEYLLDRGITQKIIDKYKIGFISKGKLANRVVIPSYDSNGNIVYWVTRAIYKWMKPKYVNSETPKDDIIFNESLINPNATIYLVEGPFDSIVVPNCIPLLGLFVSDKLEYFLHTKTKANVVIILDGEARKEANEVYKLLNSHNLIGRVRIIYLKEGMDMSKIYELYKERGIKAVLRNETILKEIDY